jgi:hypothetical protein
MVKRSPHVDAVRTEILRWLDRCEAFHGLDNDRRRRLAVALSRVGSFLAHDALWLHTEEETQPQVTAAVAELRAGVADHLGLEGNPQDPSLSMSAEMVRQIDHGDFVESVIGQLFSWLAGANAARLELLDETLASLGDLPYRPEEPAIDRPRQREIAALLVQFRDDS